jgi:hypothetical protein
MQKLVSFLVTVAILFDFIAQQPPRITARVLHLHADVVDPEVDHGIVTTDIENAKVEKGEIEIVNEGERGVDHRGNERN